MSLFSIIENAFIWACEKVVNLIILLCTPILKPISSLIPDFNFNFNFIDSGFLGFVDSFFPVAYFFSFLVLYLVLACTIYLINWILGLIPTVS